jgi:hypothetical protein
VKVTIEPSENPNIVGDTADWVTVSVEYPDNDTAIDVVMGTLIRPALIAWGFSPELVDQYFTLE